MNVKSVSFPNASCLICLGMAYILACGAYSVRAQEKLTTTRLDAPMVTAAISPDGRFVAIDVGHSAQQKDGSWNNTEWIEVIEPPSSSTVVARVDLPSAALLKSAPVSSTDGFVGYCDNGKYLAAYDLIGTVYVLSTSTYRVESKIAVGTLRAQDALGAVLGVRMACSASGSVFAVGAYGGRFGWGLVRLFSLTTGEQIAQLSQDSSSRKEFTAIDLSPSGSKLAILLQHADRKTASGPNVQIRETQQLKLLGDFSTGDAPRGLAFAGESDILTVQEQPKGSSKQILRMWDVESGKEEKQFSDAYVGVDWPVSSSADGKTILGYIPTYHECRLCNALEGRREVKKQQFAVWNKSTGSEIFRSEPFGPIVDPFGPRCILSQDGTVVMVYWPDNVITPRLFPIGQPPRG
jgi:WD40 repeat protein